MAEADTTPRDDGRPLRTPGADRRVRRNALRRLGTWLSVGLLVLVMIAGLAGTYLYRTLNGNLSIADYRDQLGPTPQKVEFTGPTDPVNILIMGYDGRDCEGCGVDGEAGAGGSDTTILVHLSRDRKHAYGVSIPRDTLVERPDCRRKDGSTVPGSGKAMWNAAYALAGPACTINQFQHVTGIPVDYSVVVTMGGFKEMVDAVGGVSICVPEEFHDEYTRTTFKKGTHNLNGDESLAYMRMRYIGNGSDIDRTRRQQGFLASLTSKVFSAGTLTDPLKLLDFLTAATRSLELSEVASTGLGSLKDLAGLGYQFKDIGLDKIQFITAPIVYAPHDGPDRGRVYLTEAADQIWTRLTNDRPLGGALTGASITADQVPGQRGPSAPSAPAAPAGDESVPTTTSSPGPSRLPDTLSEEQRARSVAGLCV